MDKYSLMRQCVTYAEIIACLTGFIYWKKIRDTYWRWFPVYLLAIVIAEGTAKYVDEVLNNRQLNVLIYQFFGIPVQFLFFFWLFYRFFKDNNYTRESKWPLLGVIIYLSAWFVELFFLRGTKLWFFSFSYTVGNVILSVFVLAFFARFINSDKILGYRSDMMFWTCLGVLLYYFGALPYYGLYNTIGGFPEFANIYWFFQMTFSCLMYLFFTIAFIWGKPKQ